jgi:hypothetical protein
VRRILGFLLALGLSLPTGAGAQATDTGTGSGNGTGPWIHYGKWVLTAGAITMNLLAAGAHQDADDAFTEIEIACFDDPDRCTLNTDGEYADPEMEEAYQTSLHYDRMARRWLILGETALVGATAMFVWEFTHKKHEPDNIPFEPEVRVLRNATGVGIKIPW